MGEGGSHEVYEDMGMGAGACQAAGAQAQMLLPVAQRQFHEALAIAQGDCVLARHGAQGLGGAPHHDDDGIATAILGKQVVYGVPVHRADAWEEWGAQPSGARAEPLRTVSLSKQSSGQGRSYPGVLCSTAPDKLFLSLSLSCFCDMRVMTHAV